MKLTLGLSMSTGHSRFWKFLLFQKGVKLDPSLMPNPSTPLVEFLKTWSLFVISGS